MQLILLFAVVAVVFKIILLLFFIVIVILVILLILVEATLLSFVVAMQVNLTLLCVCGLDWVVWAGVGDAPLVRVGQMPR